MTANRFCMVAVVLACVLALTVVTQAAPGKIKSYNDVKGSPYTVGFDSRSLLINGENILLQAGSIHYPRSTPDMWPVILQQTKAAGLNVVQIYFFWDFHEFDQGHYDFTNGSHNLAAFMQQVGDAGLFAFLRIGPYVCAEWSYGGMPVWLREQNMVFRSMDAKWLAAMESIVTTVTTVVEPYLARHGGPLILAQIENEYGNIEGSYPTGPQYVQWCGELTQKLNLSIPWVMCQQGDAPTYVINSCNGFYCDNWISGHRSSFPNQPSFWTELWSGWFASWGDAKPHRPAQDVAFAVARWVQRGGTYYNYYMWHGGTTFGRHTGGPNLVTSYDYDAPLDEYGVQHPVKYAHLSNLHGVLNTYNDAILANPIPTPSTPCDTCEIHVYGQMNVAGTVIFAGNWDDKKDYTVQIGGLNFTLPAWTVSIIDGATLKLAFRTDLVPSSDDSHEMKTMEARPTSVPTSIRWTYDSIGNYVGEPVIVATGPLEQIDTTLDHSDYLWYITNVNITEKQINNGVVQLTLSNCGDFEYIYFNSIYQTMGAFIGDKTNFAIDVSNLKPGTYPLQILSATIGIQNYGAYLDRVTRGLTGVVTLDGVDLTKNKFTHSIGLQGENEKYWADDSGNRVKWQSSTIGRVPFRWYEVLIQTPKIAPPTPPALQATFQVDVSSLGKGMIWFNEFLLGRFYNITASTTQCAPCVWQGNYGSDNCRTGCGELSLNVLHVPATLLKPAGESNRIILWDEFGGDPSGLQLIQRN